MGLNQSTKYAYILRANNSKAMAIHSDLVLEDIQEYVRERCEKLHEDGTDVVFRWGVTEFVNPVVMFVGDYGDYLPALIGIK